VAALAYASAALVTASRYLFLEPDLAGLRRNPQDLVIFPLAVAVVFMALPVLLVLWRPALAASHRLERLFDTGLALRHSGWCSRSGHLGVRLPHGSRS